MAQNDNVLDWLLEFDQFVGDGEESKFEAGGDAGLVEDVGEVALHRLLADIELLCNIAVATAFDDTGDNLDSLGVRP